ncbi:uncharacterized protein [Procambarus clarkii]|uniref:uncharacterized protein n=1 Tax=Procambarus clarkii TaxID=6728 RepID=UPI0037444576
MDLPSTSNDRSSDFDSMLYIPDVPKITTDNNNEFHRRIAVMTREHLEREYQKARAAMIQRNEYLKRLLNVEEPNSIKVTNKKQKKDNIQDVSHINSKQRPAAPQSDDILPAILSPPHIQNAGYSTSGRTYTQSYLAAGEETLESFDVGMSQHHLLVFK